MTDGIRCKGAMIVEEVLLVRVPGWTGVETTVDLQEEDGTDPQMDGKEAWEEEEEGEG